MRIATWNVNSLNVRLPHVLDWLRANPVDALCLQELKLPDERFPATEVLAAGYAAAWAGQPTYNGVAILTRSQTVGPPLDVLRGNPRYPDPQQRLITATVAGVRLVCAYFPNGQAVGSDKYAYKLAWIDALLAWLPELQRSHPLVTLAGDYNIAPEDRDVHDPAAWTGQVLCSEPERDRFRALLALGFSDAFRRFEQPDKSFSWWDYRALGFRRNAGLRIDHLLLSAPLAERAVSCTIDKAPRRLEKPSDHAPVVVEIAG